LFIEDLPFDEYFDLSFFENKSETTLDTIVLNPEFVPNIEKERENKSIDECILNSLQSSIISTNIPELLESASATLSSSVFLSSSEVHSQPQFIPTLPLQPIISNQTPITPTPP